MLSHDLARALLARRDNDVRFRVHLDVGNPEHYVTALVTLLADSALIDADMRADGEREPISYDQGLDALVVKLGVVVVNDPEEQEEHAIEVSKLRDAFMLAGRSSELWKARALEAGWTPTGQEPEDPMPS